MTEPAPSPDGSSPPPVPPIPYIVMGVGAMLAIALLAQAKEGGNWAIGGCLAAAVMLGSSLLGRLAVWAVRAHEFRNRQESERLRAMERIAEHLGRIVENLQDSPREPEPEVQAPTVSTPAEAKAESPPPPAAPAIDLAFVKRLAEFRGMLRDGRWDEARAIAQDHAESDSENPDALHREFATARRARTEKLRAELQAARDVQDADRVIDIRGELLSHLPEDEHADLNRDLASWLLHLVQRRCLTGKVASDVVVLAERVSQVFSGTREGASLHASLPTLRRCAGLCPRCSQPYNGEESACPRCLVAATPNPAWPVDEDEDEPSSADSPTSEIHPNGQT